jgi:hypothetical protein
MSMMSKVMTSVLIVAARLKVTFIFAFPTASILSPRSQLGRTLMLGMLVLQTAKRERGV